MLSFKLWFVGEKRKTTTATKATTTTTTSRRNNAKPIILTITINDHPNRGKFKITLPSCIKFNYDVKF